MMRESDPPVFFGEWLKRQRKVLDLTQAELAQCAGCSVFAIRKIESGERRPSKQLADLLADCLEIPAEDRQIFVKVARGERPVERLRTTSPEPATISSPAPMAPAPPASLPLSPTPLVGREPELATLSRLLQDPQCRMLTLLGPGGTGKTRLAIEAAGRQRGLFPQGTFFVPLASLNSATFLVPAIADAMGFSFQGQIEPRVQLLRYLAAKETLLVLDNFEHLLDGVGLFVEILESAPKVKLLFTSRERLNLQSEWVFEVQGLPVPPTDQAERAEEYSAVVLFVQSALRAKASFQPGVEEWAAIVRICQIMEGMPLGIELAAAWVSTLTCQEIAQEIEHDLDFLTTSMRDVPERQRSLRAAFEHSWKLLSADEHRVLRRLALFHGEFEREAAEHVAGATLASLMALVSKSLVRHKESGRYDLHEVVRQYSSVHLDDDPQCAVACDRHSDFYLALLRERETLLKGAGQQEALRELMREIDNIRAAWVWAIKRERSSSVENALRGIALFNDLAGSLRQGVEQLEQVAQSLRARSTTGESQRVLGRALAQQGYLLFRLGQFSRALALLNESLALLRPMGDQSLLVDPLMFNGIILHLYGDYSQAQRRLDECLACAQAAGDEWFAVYASYNQGYITSLLGRYAEGYEQMQVGLAMWRSLGDLRSVALGLNHISPTAVRMGCFEEAGAYLQESLALSTQLGDRWGMGTAYRYMGLAALAQGNIAEAQSHIQKSLDIFTDFVTGWDIVKSHIFLAEAKAAAGDVSEARQIFMDAAESGAEAQVIPLVLDAFVGLGDLDAASGEALRALELTTFVANHDASTHEAKDRAGLLAAKVKSELSSQQIQMARERAKTRSLDEILSEILGRDPAGTTTSQHSTHYKKISR